MRPFDKRRRRTAGITLLEVAIGIALSAIVAAGVMATVSWSTNQVKLRATADRMNQVLSAAQQYVQANYATLAANVPVGGAPTTVPTTGAVGPFGLPTLQGGGYLPSSYVDKNPFAQTHAVLVRQPVANTLEVLVATQNGDTIQDADLGTVSSMVGAAGGFMPSQGGKMVTSGTYAANTVVGSYGGWSTTSANWGNIPVGSHLFATAAYNNGNVIADYLYRYNVGVPEANKMHTDIDDNQNNINHVTNLDTQTIDTTTGTPGNLTVNDNAVLVGTNATPPACGATTNNPGCANFIFKGSITTTDDLGPGSGQGYFSSLLTANTGVTINNNSNLTWTGGGCGGTCGSIAMPNNQWIVASANVSIQATSFTDDPNHQYIVQPSQNSVFNNVLAYYVAPQYLWSETLLYGTTHGNGTYKLGDLLPKFVYIGNEWVNDTGSGVTVSAPEQCGTGGYPKIVLSVQAVGWGYEQSWAPPAEQPPPSVGGGVDMYANAIQNAAGSTGQWTVYLEVDNGGDSVLADTSPWALATFYCWYP
jgi:type II secretory pathway pseudopilin PulG